MENQLEKLGVAIKDARLHAEMKQKELAASLHITPRHLTAIENGRQKPSYDLLCLLVNSLALPIEDVFYPEKVHDRKELEEVVSMVHYCDDDDLLIISAALHAIMKNKSKRKHTTQILVSSDSQQYTLVN
jgi:DNA-binding XRE family transcriptional regulator